MREIKTRLGGHWTGVVWLLGVPVAQLAMFVWMNSMIRGRDTHGLYPWASFLICGMMPYRLFKSLWTSLTNAPSANRGLFGFRQVKPMDTYLARTVLDVLLDTVTYLLIAVGLWRIGFSPIFPHDPLAFMGIVGVFVATGFGMGMTWSVLVGFSPRIGTFTSIVSMPLMIVSGVIFPLHGMPAEMLSWLLLNPILHLVELARVAFLPGYVPVGGVGLGFPMLFALVMVTLGMVLYRLRRHHLAAG